LTEKFLDFSCNLKYALYNTDIEKGDRKMNNEIYIVLCDGFPRSEFMSLADAENVHAHWLKCTQTYQYECSIYMKKEDGNLTRYKRG
jgi:hypothetical protein